MVCTKRSPQSSLGGAKRRQVARNLSGIRKWTLAAGEQSCKPPPDRIFPSQRDPARDSAPLPHPLRETRIAPLSPARSSSRPTRAGRNGALLTFGLLTWAFLWEGRGESNHHDQLGRS